MKKLFISQPKRGKTDDEILNERDKAIESAIKLLNEKIEVIDSFFQDIEEPFDVKQDGLYWLGKSLELLATADVTYFSPGWQDARGCRIEHKCAKECGII